MRKSASYCCITIVFSLALGLKPGLAQQEPPTQSPPPSPSSNDLPAARPEPTSPTSPRTTGGSSSAGAPSDPTSPFLNLGNRISQGLQSLRNLTGQFASAPATEEGQADQPNAASPSGEEPLSV